MGRAVLERWSGSRALAQERIRTGLVSVRRMHSDRIHLVRNSPFVFENIKEDIFIEQVRDLHVSKWERHGKVRASGSGCPLGTCNT